MTDFWLRACEAGPISDKNLDGDLGHPNLKNCQNMAILKKMYLFMMKYDEIYKNGKLQNEICKLKFAKGNLQNLQNLFFQWNM